MMVFWEECKFCLKQICMKFYVCVCRSGLGLVGCQFEEFLNQSLFFYFWMNGDCIDFLLENDWQQMYMLDVMQDYFSCVFSIIDEFFQDRFFIWEFQDIYYYLFFSLFYWRFYFFFFKFCIVCSLMFFFLYEFLNFYVMFQFFFEMIYEVQQVMDIYFYSLVFQYLLIEFI